MTATAGFTPAIAFETAVATKAVVLILVDESPLLCVVVVGDPGSATEEGILPATAPLVVVKLSVPSAAETEETKGAAHA